MVFLDVGVGHRSGHRSGVGSEIESSQGCRESSGLFAHEAVVTEDGPHPAVRVEPTAQLDTGVISAAVPLPCHSQRS
jgi:hypothetical protein